MFVGPCKLYKFALLFYQTYYGTVIAETEAGSVQVTSDGVTVLPHDSLPNGLQVLMVLYVLNRLVSVLKTLYNEITIEPQANPLVLQYTAEV